MSGARKEDVYESEDLPEVDQNAKFAREATQDPENVQMMHIDFEAAQKRFKGRIVNADDVDFSDSIAKKRQNAYGSGKYVLEIVGSQYDEAENAEQKFNRLTYELAELAELVKSGETGDSGLLSENAVSEMLDELKAIRVAKTSGVSAAHASSAPAKPLAATDPAISSLEHRLRRVEAAVGGRSDAQPLADAIEDIKFRTEALNPAYVEGAESRLTAVLSKLEQTEEKRAVQPDAQLENKVDELYSLMLKWDSACQQLPANVKKLHALHRLHEQASQVTERVSQLAGIREQVEKAIAADSIAICELQSKARDEVAALVKRIQSLESRVSTLGK